MTGPSPNQEQPEGSVIDLATAAPVVEQARQPTVTVSLDDVESDVGQVSEARERAVVFGMYADTWSRVGMVAVMAIIFVGLNWLVIDFLNGAFAVDVRMLESKPPALLAADRLVTSNVLMTLIGATVVQVGVAIAAIVSYLFPKSNGRGD